VIGNQSPVIRIRRWEASGSPAWSNESHPAIHWQPMKSHYAERFIENWMSHRSKAATCLVRLLRYNGRMSTISMQEIQREFHGFLRSIEAGEVFVLV